IGGADGLAPHLREGAVSFGRMVWPHMLARVMLAEQIYRATTIIDGRAPLRGLWSRDKSARPT
ncbi:MAG: 23S rRNA (pseudouridine(1915)-N(3))-methyltransferase RlmH, partial [Pseudomonadota bacterium]